MQQVPYKEKNWKEKWTFIDSITFLFNESKKRSKGIRRIRMIFDAIISYKRYGATFHDYMNLRFYTRTEQEKDTFITTNMVQREKRNWDSVKLDIVDNKKSFNELFKDYAGREWIDTDDKTYKDFCTFLNKFEFVFVKPKRESSGIGIKKCRVQDISDKEKFYTSCKGCLIEEPISIHEEMKKLNPNSVSFVRVVTVANENNINILATTLRTGGKKEVPFNTAKDDIFSQINIETGVCFTNGFDESGEEYEKHPVSGIPFKGFQIPYWDKVIESSKDGARRISEVRIIGWDIAITEQGIAFFEGNPGSGVASMQIADGIGKKELFYKYLG